MLQDMPILHHYPYICLHMTIPHTLFIAAGSALVSSPHKTIHGSATVPWHWSDIHMAMD